MGIPEEGQGQAHSEPDEQQFLAAGGYVSTRTERLGSSAHKSGPSPVLTVQPYRMSTVLAKTGGS